MMSANRLRLLACSALGALALAATAQETGKGAGFRDTAAYQAPLAQRAPLMTAVRAGERIVAAGDFGTILVSDDGGRSWRQAATPTRATLTALHFIDAKHGWAAGHGGVLLETRDGGTQWTRLASLGADVVPFALHFEDERRGLAVGAFGYAAMTEDGGRNWNPVRISAGEYADQHLYAIFSGPDKRRWITAEGGGLYRAEGDAFVPVPLPYKGSIWGGMTLSDGAVLVWGMRGNLLRSEDGGRSWRSVASGTQQALTAGVQRAGGEVVLAGLGGAVVRSKDAGRSFGAQTRPERQSHTALVEAGGALLSFTLAGLGGDIK